MTLAGLWSIHTFQRSSPLNRLADESQILCGASLGRGTKVCSRDLGHMTKMAAMPIYGKNHSKIFFSRTGGPISMKLGLKHPGLQSIVVCENDDIGMTLTYFTARSILNTLFFTLEKVKTMDF